MKPGATDGKRSPLVNKFWLRMGEKIGRRWYEQYGPAASAEWASLIDQYSEYQVDLALDNLPKWEYPPTHPVVAAHLRAFAAKTGDRAPGDWSRDFWHSAIVGELEHWGWIQGLWKKGTRLESMLGADRRVLQQAVIRLVDEVLDAEYRLGQRSSGLFKKLTRDCEHVITSLRTPTNDPTADRYD